MLFLSYILAVWCMYVCMCGVYVCVVYMYVCMCGVYVCGLCMHVWVTCKGGTIMKALQILLH